MKAILSKLIPTEPCQSRYAVMLGGKNIGTVSKYDDSWVTKFKWKAWFGSRYLGEFDDWEDAVKLMQDLTKQQTRTKE